MKPYVAIACAALLVAACREEAVTQPQFDTAAHAQEVEQWQTRRAERLQAEDGWLTLIGLFWLNEGQNVITVPSKSVPAPIRLVRNGETVTLDPAEGLTIDGQPVSAPAQLRSDAHEQGPTIVQIGSVRFNVIRRGERLGLRVKDAQAETRTKFEGLEYFPTDPKWRVEARLEPYDPPKKIPIDDVTGMRSESISPGALVFTVDGKEYRLDPVLEEGSDDLFIIFKDRTSADATYPAGRYLYTPKPGADGKTYIDFNRAYNPPCAFTPFATCPLPPVQNRLPFRIEAGEKKYSGAH
jgi:uncharacterized protein (DUF1684 family)